MTNWGLVALVPSHEVFRVGPGYAPNPSNS